MLGTCGKLSVCTVNPYHIAGWYYGPFLDVRIRFIWVGIIVFVSKESWWTMSSLNKYERWLIQFVASAGQRRGVRGVSFVTLLFTTLQVAQWSKASDCCTKVLHDRSIPVGHSAFFFFFFFCSTSGQTEYSIFFMILLLHRQHTIDFSKHS